MSYEMQTVRELVILCGNFAVFPELGLTMNSVDEKSNNRAFLIKNAHRILRADTDFKSGTSRTKGDQVQHALVCLSNF